MKLSTLQVDNIIHELDFLEKQLLIYIDNNSNYSEQLVNELLEKIDVLEHKLEQDRTNIRYS